MSLADVRGKGTAGRGNGRAKDLRHERASRVAQMAKGLASLGWCEGRGPERSAGQGGDLSFRSE